MRAPMLEAGVALAALLSAAVLAVMLAAPLLPQPPAFTFPSSTPVPTAGATATGPPAPPIGLYQLRGRLQFSGPCAAIELGPRSYPVEPGAEGTASVLWWETPIADPLNPGACSSRVGGLNEVAASVTAVADEDDPDGPPIGYAVRFTLPRGGTSLGGQVELLVLLARSTAEQLQAVDRATSGSGLVFDRVTGVDPTEVPAPSPSASAADA